MIPHPWNLSPAEAITLQKQLAQQVDTATPLALATLKLVAGVDVSVKDNLSRAAIVVLSFPALQVLETVTAEMPTPFPYIPGLLSFREGAVILAAHAQLRLTPDVYIFDGMGIIHPRRLGIASHIGLWLQKPTIGCGKTHFLGDYQEPESNRGAFSPLTIAGEVCGAVLRTRDRVKPVYISVGHQATLETALDLTLRCTSQFRLPDPIRAAHNAAGQ